MIAGSQIYVIRLFTTYLIFDNTVFRNVTLLRLRWYPVLIPPHYGEKAAGFVNVKGKEKNGREKV
jgi:hypothetical protein